MQFNSYIFILLFLPVTVFLYYFFTKVVSIKAGNIVLILASALFYLYAGAKCFAILMLSLFINFCFANLIRKRTKLFVLFLSILSNVVILLYFKYFNFFISNIQQILELQLSIQDIILPLGISFITFQQIAYLVNVYQNKLPIHGFVEYALYVLYFPKLIMGPLIEPSDFIKQIQNNDRRNLKSENVVIGVRMLNLGLLKKIIIADTFARAVDWGFGNLELTTSADLIIVMLSYTFQIYFDFSGYSDMAIGISKIFNIELPVNFDSPYKSYSIVEFWERWHISLTKFLTKYIYIPLGGNRKGKFRTYLNILIVFLISGLWHGANWTFVLWGALHGMISVIEKIFVEQFSKIHKGLQWIINFLTINILWLLFRAESIGQWKDILKDILRFSNTSISEDLLNCFNLPEMYAILDFLHLVRLDEGIRGFSLLVFLVIAFGICLILENNNKRKYQNNFVTAIFSAGAFLWALISLGYESSFIYFGF